MAENSNKGKKNRPMERGRRQREYARAGVSHMSDVRSVRVARARANHLANAARSCGGEWYANVLAAHYRKVGNNPPTKFGGTRIKV